MLVTAKRGGLPFLLLLLVLTAITTFHFISTPGSRPLERVRQWISDAHAPQGRLGDEQSEASPVDSGAVDEPSVESAESVPEKHQEISSSMLTNGTYFPIVFGDYPAINPNIIPHPTLPETFIIVAQHHDREHNRDKNVWVTELVCNAVFRNGNLQCERQPMILPIAATSSGHCDGKFAFYHFNMGPHDARVFWGPDRPFIIYGSNSQRNCWGQWMQDFRLLVDWPDIPELLVPFRYSTDLQRPPPYSPLEKNWCAFWSADGQMYLHYDMTPQRSFAKVDIDGSVGKNLADTTKGFDNLCIRNHLPVASASPDDSIHQATNSLAITMCRRSDPTCKRTQDNTYIMTVVQHKIYSNFRSVYEPYVVLFGDSAPFQLHAISSKPIWVNGRKRPGERKDIPSDQSEMLYLTSMNWKKKGLRYHGFLDDVLMIGFGIEDRDTGGIDVVAEDLLANLALCNG